MTTFALKLCFLKTLVGAEAWLFGGGESESSDHPFGGRSNSTWLAWKVAEGEFFVSRASEYRHAVKSEETSWMVERVTAPFRSFSRGEQVLRGGGGGEQVLRGGGDGGALAFTGDNGAAAAGGSLSALLESSSVDGAGRHAGSGRGPEGSGVPKLSAVLRLEALAGTTSSETEAAEAVAELFPPPVFDASRGDTAHIYVSAPESAALANHTDTTDVLVLQIGGRKEWTICPPAPVDASTFDKPSTCATYDAEEMATMDACESVVLAPGDLLFVPRRSVHGARALEAASTRRAASALLHVAAEESRGTQRSTRRRASAE